MKKFLQTPIASKHLMHRFGLPFVHHFLALIEWFSSSIGTSLPCSPTPKPPSSEAPQLPRTQAPLHRYLNFPGVLAGNQEQRAGTTPLLQFSLLLASYS